MTFNGVVDTRSSRAGLFLCLMLGLLVDASDVLAAELRQVRIGKHAEFTRIVFELDQAAEYKIERMDPKSDVAELVVMLSASSISRRIRSSNSLIEQVSVEPSGSDSIARIRLTKRGLRLKELILANPPRIVLDVLSEKSTISKVVSDKAEVVPKREAVPSLDAPTFEEIVAQLPPDKKSAASTSSVEPVRVVIDEPTISTPLEESKLAQPDKGNPPESADPIPISVDEAARLQWVAPTEDVPETAARTPHPMVVRTKMPKAEERGWTTWILFGGAALLLLVMGRLAGQRLARRGRGDRSNDEATSLAEGGGPQTFSDINPFGEFSRDGRQMTLRSSGATDNLEEKNVEDVEMISQEQVNENLSGMSPASGGVSDEYHQMIREMNLQVESLEGRIEELVDARDRLERQVAAQAEELRVQRAAIARTQRAVRNLARSEEEDNEDEEVDEPAFPDPDSQDEE